MPVIRRSFYRLVILSAGLLSAGLLSASAALAAATLAIDDDIGPPTKSIVLTGKGFAKSAIVDVYFDLQQVAFKATGSKGKFSLKMKIPANALPGTHTITVLPHFGAGATAQTEFLVRTNWLSWRGPPTGTGWNQTENVLTVSTASDLDLEWSVKTTSGPNGAPVLYGENVYFVQSNGHLLAYNRETRKLVFDADATANSILAPAAGDGKIYLGGPDKLQARNAKTGALVWQAVLPSGVGTPTYADGRVYAVAEGSADAGLFAFELDCGKNGATCTPLWRGPGGNTASYYIPEASVSVAHGQVYALLNQMLYAFAVDCAAGGASCTPLSTHEKVTSYAAAVANNLVYVSHYDGANGKLLALRADYLFYEAWNAPLPAATYSGLAAGRGKVVVASGSTLSVFSDACVTSPCTPQWTTAIPSTAYAVTITRDLIFVPTAQDIYVFPLSCYNGCPALWQGGSGGVYSNAPYASVSVADGKVYSPGSSKMAVYATPITQADRVKRKPVAISQLKPDPRFADAERELAEQLASER